MEIRSRIFEKYKDWEFSIPLKQGDRVMFKGKKIKVGDILLEKSESTLKKSLSVPKVLNCKNEDCEKYVLRMDGEYIEEGELLAQRVSSGGLNMFELFSPVSGVVDLSRIKQGYIDILGEERKSTIMSDFTGTVKGIDPIEGLLINTDVICVDGVVSSKTQERLFGNLEILGDGNTILTEKSLDDDYRGKIVWVGPYLYNRVAIELFERGAIAVLTYAMSYTEFREIGLPIMILGGFGSVHCDSAFLKKFISLRNKFVILDGKQNQLYILSNSDINHKGWFVKQYTNQSVISRSSSTYGYIGKVLEFDEDSNFALVDFGKRGTSLIHIGLLEFIDL
ncbi:MAG: hypothetical protein RBS01_00625 [Candidatus Dojkabacteria bacterium]|jgi:hypothetical protein|nr:hypothetical protein [Candidatus Dojkabacteria bacterium]